MQEPSLLFTTDDPSWSQFQNVLRVFRDYCLMLHPTTNAARIDVANKLLESSMSKSDGLKEEFEKTHRYRFKKTERTMVVHIIETDGRYIRLLPDEYAMNQLVALDAVLQNGFAYKELSEILKEDKKIAYSAFRRNGLALKFAPEAIQNDEDAVLVAVGQNGLALIHASESMRDNRRVVVTALRENVASFEFASKRLRADPTIALEAVKLDGRLVEHLDQKFLSDNGDILRTAIKQIDRSKREKSFELPFEYELSNYNVFDAFQNALIFK